MNIDRLTCNYSEDPLGVETPVPRFNWSLSGGDNDQMQTAYHIVEAVEKPSATVPFDGAGGFQVRFILVNAVAAPLVCLP